MLGFIFGIYVILNILVTMYYGLWNLERKEIDRLTDLEVIDIIACIIFPILGVLILIAGICMIIYDLIINILIKYLEKKGFYTTDNKQDFIKHQWQQSKLYNILYTKIKR